MDPSSGKEPLLENPEYSSRVAARRARAKEVAGRSMAECVAVCCCCPCGLADFLVMAAYKVPAGLCRKTLKKKRLRKLTKKGMMRSSYCNCDENDLEFHPLDSDWEDILTHEEVIGLDEEMFDKFFDGGFWRSPSQREASF